MNEDWWTGFGVANICYRHYEQRGHINYTGNTYLYSPSRGLVEKEEALERRVMNSVRSRRSTLR